MSDNDREFGEIQTKLEHFEEYRKETTKAIREFRRSITGIEIDFARSDSSTKAIIAQLIKLNKNHVDQLQKISLKVEDCDAGLLSHQTSLDEFGEVLDELSQSLIETADEVSKLQKLRIQILTIIVAVPILLTGLCNLTKLIDWLKALI